MWKLIIFITVIHTNAMNDQKFPYPLGVSSFGEISFNYLDECDRAGRIAADNIQGEISSSLNQFITWTCAPQDVRPDQLRKHMSSSPLGD